MKLPASSFNLVQHWPLYHMKSLTPDERFLSLIPSLYNSESLFGSDCIHLHQLRLRVVVCIVFSMVFSCLCESHLSPASSRELWTPFLTLRGYLRLLMLFPPLLWHTSAQWAMAFPFHSGLCLQGSFANSPRKNHLAFAKMSFIC